MNLTGIIEGFFGPEWSWDARRSVCQFLADQGDGFYIYAPKRDPYLRKNWHQDHPAEMWTQLAGLSNFCSDRKVKFGIGLSPFELFASWGDNESKVLLRNKILKLKGLNIDYLGLFFDDMKSSSKLAEQQVSIVNFVQDTIQTPIIFCPTYYTPDPILDKVFGQRPPGYLEFLGTHLHQNVQICWTGNKVISDIIQPEDLKSVTEVLRRKPFIWDNFFANDGPKQCKYLKIKPLLGRNQQSLLASAGWAFNLMNQPALSLVAYFNSVKQLGSSSQENSILKSLKYFCEPKLADLIFENRDLLLNSGLDKIDSSLKLSLQDQLKWYTHPVASEIVDWLKGQYNVGPECLTD